MRAVLALYLLSVVTGCFVEDVSTVSQRVDVRVPVVYDTDMDFDDAMALAYLCQAHKLGQIELRAVTVTENGAALPGAGIQWARCILQQCGLSTIPVADGSPTAPQITPASIHTAATTVMGTVLAGCTQSPVPTLTADSVLVSAVESSPSPVAILTSGPVSNLAAALRTSRVLHPLATTLPFVANTRSITMMMGAVYEPGNMPPDTLPQPDGTQEINAWVDPASLQSVIAAFPPATVHLVPLDATNDVPITADYVARISADHTTAEATLVNSIVTHPLVSVGSSLITAYWWDPLAAVAATRSDVVTMQSAPISVVQSGASAGRTLPGSGVSTQYGSAADKGAFEDAFLATINGR